MIETNELLESIDNAVNVITSRRNNFEGDFADLSEIDTDYLCYEFLKAMPRWWDDVLPASIMGPEDFLHELYAEDLPPDSIGQGLRREICRYLGPTLDELVLNSYGRVMNIPPEEPQGWRAGQ